MSIKTRILDASTRREKIEALLDMSRASDYGEESWDYNGFRAAAAIAFALLEIADVLTDMSVTMASAKNPPTIDTRS